MPSGEQQLPGSLWWNTVEPERAHTEPKPQLPNTLHHIKVPSQQDESVFDATTSCDWPESQAERAEDFPILFPSLDSISIHTNKVNGSVLRSYLRSFVSDTSHALS